MKCGNWWSWSRILFCS